MAEVEKPFVIETGEKTMTTDDAATMTGCKGEIVVEDGENTIDEREEVAIYEVEKAAVVENREIAGVDEDETAMVEDENDALVEEIEAAMFEDDETAAVLLDTKAYWRKNARKVETASEDEDENEEATTISEITGGSGLENPRRIPPYLVG